MLSLALTEALRELGGEVVQRGEELVFTKVLAERRVFLARKKLVYRARLRVDENTHEVRLVESLTETSSGLAGDSGVQFQAESYRTRPALREGTIAEQAKLFGANYCYTFDFEQVRTAVERVVREHGYTLRHALAG